MVRGGPLRNRSAPSRTPASTRFDWPGRPARDLRANAVGPGRPHSRHGPADDGRLLALVAVSPTEQVHHVYDGDVADGPLQPQGNLQNAARVGGGDHLRARVDDVAHLRGYCRLGDLRMDQVVDPGRAITPIR